MDVWKQKGVIDLDQMGIRDAFNTVEKEHFNQGDSLYGSTDQGVKKEAVKVINDGQGKITPILKVSKKVKTGDDDNDYIVTKHTQADGKTGVYMAPSDPTPPGLAPGGSGNIDLSQRPVRLNGNGSVSTVLSKSFEIDGKEVLLPKVADDGHIKTDTEMKEDYKKDGKHLGIFNTSQDADAYAQHLHSDPIWKADMEKHKFDKDKGEWSYEAPATHGHSADPNDGVVQKPIAIIAKQYEVHDRQLAVAQSILARMDPKKKLETIEKEQKTIEESKATKKAMEGLSRTNPDDKIKFIERLPDTMSISDKTKLADDLWSKTTVKPLSRTGQLQYDRDAAEKAGDKKKVQELDDQIKADREKGKKRTMAEEKELIREKAKHKKTGGDGEKKLSAADKNALKVIDDRERADTRALEKNLELDPDEIDKRKDAIRDKADTDREAIKAGEKPSKKVARPETPKSTKPVKASALKSDEKSSAASELKGQDAGKYRLKNGKVVEWTGSEIR
jgi:hypothetical protein